jgi:ABC-type nitrate/sulfonate/bicarbonate transport system permease component
VLAIVAAWQLLAGTLINPYFIGTPWSVASTLFDLCRSGEPARRVAPDRIAA